MTSLVSTNAPGYARWNFEAFGEPSGELVLHKTPVGFAWTWQQKPDWLVNLLGVAAEEKQTPWVFAEFDTAVRHVLRCTGRAYHGRCSLTVAH